MLTAKTEVIHNPVISMLAALKWIDKRLEYPERRILYQQEVGSNRAVFMLDSPYPFQVGDSLRMDVGMAGFFGKKAMLNSDDKLNPDVLARLVDEGFNVSQIVCVGDSVSSWIVAGKHFLLEMRNSKFD